MKFLPVIFYFTIICVVFCQKEKGSNEGRYQRSFAIVHDNASKKDQLNNKTRIKDNQTHDREDSHKARSRTENHDDVQAIRTRLKDKNLNDVSSLKNSNNVFNDLQNVVCMMDCKTTVANIQKTSVPFRSSGKKENVTEKLERAWGNMTDIEREFIMEIARNASVRDEIAPRMTQAFAMSFSGAFNTLQIFQTFSNWCVQNCNDPFASSGTSTFNYVNNSNLKQKKTSKSKIKTTTQSSIAQDLSDEWDQGIAMRQFSTSDRNKSSLKLRKPKNIVSPEVLENIFRNVTIPYDLSNLICYCMEKVEDLLRCHCRTLISNRISVFNFKRKFRNIF